MAQILAAGIFVDGLAMVPLILLYGAFRPGGPRLRASTSSSCRSTLSSCGSWCLDLARRARHSRSTVVRRRFGSTFCDCARVLRDRRRVPASGAAALAMAAGLAALGLGIAMPGLFSAGPSGRVPGRVRALCLAWPAHLFFFCRASEVATLRGHHGSDRCRRGQLRIRDPG